MTMLITVKTVAACIFFSPLLPVLGCYVNIGQDLFYLACKEFVRNLAACNVEPVQGRC